MQATCGTAATRVRLDLIQGDAHLRPVFKCRVVRLDETAAEAKLVDLVSHRHDAARRADLVVMLSHELRIPRDRSLVVWSIGSGIDGCYRIADTNFHRQEIAAAARQLPPPARETSVRWTEIEAVRFAGTCPEQLRAFFDSVASAGYPAAAAIVRSELTRLGVRT